MTRKPATKRVNIMLNTDLLKKIDRFAVSHEADRSTAVRQLVLFALHHTQILQAIERYKAREITLRQIGELLGISYWEVNDLLAAYNVPIQDLVPEEVEEQIRLVNTLTNKHKTQNMGRLTKTRSIG